MTNYFENIFASAQPAKVEAITNLVESRVTLAMNDELKEVHPKEIKQTLFQMFPTQSSGARWYECSLFLQKFWHIVRIDLTKAILSALSDGNILKEICRHKFCTDESHSHKIV